MRRGRKKERIIINTTFTTINLKLTPMIMKYFYIGRIGKCLKLCVPLSWLRHLQSMLSNSRSQPSGKKNNYGGTVPLRRHPLCLYWTGIFKTWSSIAHLELLGACHAYHLLRLSIHEIVEFRIGSPGKSHFPSAGHVPRLKIHSHNQIPFKHGSSFFMTNDRQPNKSSIRCCPIHRGCGLGNRRLFWAEW